MKKSLFYIGLCFVASTATLASCSTEDIKTYDGVDSGIFIQQISTTDMYGNPRSYRDSSEVSFSNYAEDVTALYSAVIIRAIGFTSDVDRAYKIGVVPEKTNAVEGVDFDLSENASVIKAGASTDTYRVKLLRTPRLREERLYVTIRVEPNENFSVPMEYLKNSASWSEDGDSLSTTEYKFVFSEEYTLPWPWTLSSYWPAYFGDYTVAKLLVVNKVMGYTYLSWSDGTVAYGKLPFMAGETQKYLQKMADAGTPVIDDDGSYMQLATNYLVNYSAYVTDNE